MKKDKICPHCDIKMTLITGVVGHKLKNPYFKCLKCGEEILIKNVKN